MELKNKVERRRDTRAPLASRFLDTWYFSKLKEEEIREPLSLLASRYSVFFQVERRRDKRAPLASRFSILGFSVSSGVVVLEHRTGRGSALCAPESLV